LLGWPAGVLALGVVCLFACAVSTFGLATKPDEETDPPSRDGA